MDTKEQTLTGVIDNSDGKSYIIKMTNDLSKDIVSDDKLFQNAKETMLNANADNKLLREGDTVFHSQKTHLMVFYINTIKWGPMKQVSFMSRNGKEYFSIQILFPVKLEDIDKPIPEEILRFDNTVKIEYK